jgi:hypothetical protein
MSSRPHGRARVDPRYPQAFAWCDRCQFQFNLVDLQWQYQWAGAQLQNKRILVCNRCLDKPQEQLRTITLPADPVPVMYPRPPRAAGDGFGPQPSGDTPNPDPNNPLIPP